MAKLAVEGKVSEKSFKLWNFDNIQEKFARFIFDSVVFMKSIVDSELYEYITKSIADGDEVNSEKNNELSIIPPAVHSILSKTLNHAMLVSDGSAELMMSMLPMLRTASNVVSSEVKALAKEFSGKIIEHSLSPRSAAVVNRIISFIILCFFFLSSSFMTNV